MYTVKIDKKGKILIPASVRKSMNLFIGQKMTMKNYGENIEIIPFEYKCRWCGTDIPEGDEYGSCNECRKKNTRRVY